LTDYQGVAGTWKVKSHLMTELVVITSAKAFQYLVIGLL